MSKMLMMECAILILIYNLSFMNLIGVTSWCCLEMVGCEGRVNRDLDRGVL